MPIILNPSFHSMRSIICGRSLLDLYQYHPGFVGLFVVQFTLLPPLPDRTVPKEPVFQAQISIPLLIPFHQIVAHLP